MIVHSIEQARAARQIDHVIVSTDGDEIAASARETGVEIVMRPPDLASDQASVDSAVRHAIEASGVSSRTVVILYANVPIRPPGLIDKAINHLRQTGADSVQSYEPVGKHHPWWMVRIEDNDSITAWHPNDVYRRQDLPPAYFPDGGVIALTRESLFTVEADAPHAFLGRDRRGIISEIGSVIDIDDEIDMLVAEAIIKRREVDRTHP
jgi:N-acylneuraminate cytidylyltransferase